MRKEALDYIACPTCKKRLALDRKMALEADHIISGALHCTGCSCQYPIFNGVPRLLPQTVKSQDLHTGKAYSGYYSEVTPEKDIAGGTLYGQTVREELQDFCAKTGIHDLNRLRKRRFVDAGCGLARIDGPLSEYCRVVVAFDISPSVERGFRAWRDISNIHVVQGDLTCIPVLPGLFDVVWCDGALPYVSDLFSAIDELLKLRASNGLLYSWCYDAKITIGERIGRLYHIARLPLKIRFFLIRITVWALAATLGTILRGRNMYRRAGRFSESVFDYSLADRVNHISKSQINSILQPDGSADDSMVVEKNGRVEFRIGSLR